MVLAPLATVMDLEALGVDTSDAGLVDLALNAASESVRSAAGCAISQETSTIHVEGRPSPWLGLPFSPVTSVASVAIDDSEVTDWRLISGSLYRRSGWSVCGPSVVSITATHGRLVVPADIVLLVCELAAAGINAAVEGIEVKTRVQSEGIDDYTVSYITGAEAMASVMELPERSRQRLAQRFGGGSHVVGVRS